MAVNLESILLASAARTTLQQLAVQDNYGGRGVQVILDISVASGAGGLTVKIQGINPVSGNLYQLNVSPTAITATGIYVYELYPGSSPAGSAGTGLVQQRTSAILPKSWSVLVSVGDSSSYTYSLSAVIIQ